MIRNYLKIAFRNLIKHKAYSAINITGLAIGIVCCMIILLYIGHELSYDKFHKNADQIYRIATKIEFEGRIHEITQSPAPMAPALIQDFPEVLNAVRIYRVFWHRNFLRYKDKLFYEDCFFYADPSFFEIFTFPLIQGNSETALKEPNSLVLTEKAARKYFGEDNPLEKILTLNNKEDYKVTGVLKNIPQNSHFKFDFLASLSPEIVNASWSWQANNYKTYILLRKGDSSQELEKKLPSFGEKYLAGEIESLDPEYQKEIKRIQPVFTYYLQPLTGIHFHSHLLDEFEANSDITNIYIFSFLAFLILLIACVNFMNLSTARSTVRAKEVGLRKVIGARRSQLIKQFLGESLIVTTLAALISIVLLEVFLPYFNNIAGTQIKFAFIHNPSALFMIFGIVFCVGLISGSYPAFFISSFIPIKVLKGTLASGRKGLSFRNIFVVFQFAASIGMIFGFLIVCEQLNFIRNRKLGFNKDNMVVVSLPDRESRQKYEVLKNEFLKNPQVIHASASSYVPGGERISNNPFIPEGFRRDQALGCQTLKVDHDFIETYGIELAEGRDFSKNIALDRIEAFIVNEAFVRRLGWKTAVGKGIDWDYSVDRKGMIVGVIKDFHFMSLHQKIEPIVLHIYEKEFNYLSVLVRTQNISETITLLRSAWNNVRPNIPFEYYFLDDNFNNLYQSEQRLSRIFNYFSLFAIFVACLGLFGLASFHTERRTKEIGIRKVLGASVTNVTVMLSKEFTKWVLVANVIAWPVAYYAMNRWLQNFAYRINVNIWIFIFSALLVIGVALMTVSFQAVKAAIANPVEALKYE
jgi:putative ABC transport system permease protein